LMWRSLNLCRFLNKRSFLLYLLPLQYLSVISFPPTVFVFVCGINCGLV
jgi:hypothetical protein